MTNYSYQTVAANKVLSNALNTKFQASVLAATPGSGKTTISHIIINNYLKLHPKARVIVLTHGMDLLKDQYLNDLKNPNVQINFTFGEFGEDVQVQVGIPQSANKLTINKIDLLLVDEAHQYYLESMVQNIIQTLNPTYQILMTGSPSVFINANKMSNKFAIYSLSYEDLVKYGVFSPVEISVTETEDSTIQGKLKAHIAWARQNRKNLSKIMIAVSSIQDGIAAQRFLASLGRKVVLSTSKNDEDSVGIAKFKDGEYDALVAVNRGVLGFSDSKVSGLFDLRCSPDLDVSVQLFARVLRKHPLGIKKFYYRTANKKNYMNQAKICAAIKGFMDSKVFQNYDGKNLTVKI